MVNHASVSIDARTGDTTLKINPLVDIPPIVKSMEQLLFWAIVLGDWWVQTLKYLANTETPTVPTDTPLGNWGAYLPPAAENEVSDGESIDSQFDEYNGTIDTGGLPDMSSRLTSWRGCDR